MDKKDIDYNNLNRWRLILGNFAENNIQLNNEYSEIDEALGFLYDREYSEESGYANFDKEDKTRGGRGKSTLTVPTWVAKVKKLFPKKTVEIMQNQALEKYNLTEMITNEDILKEMEPNMDLLKNILTFKDMMDGNVKKLAYEIVRKVVNDLKKKLESDVKKVFYGKKLPNSTTQNKIFKNLDIKKTIRNNLKNYNVEDRTIFVDKLYFNQNIKKYNPWHIIILIDESGSMFDSIIYSSVMASIFSNLPYLSIKLIIFDTAIVDLSDYVKDPIDILFKVQLGGGTDIYKALEYAKKITTVPDKTIVLLISDLYDGNDYKYMYGSANDIIESRSKLFILPALDYNADASYDKTAAAKFAKMGAKVAAITPDELSKWISSVIS
ncbi:VWA domain-containing protein [uncultured Brachyspira sp.]|uniref:VWA domain-containing protein n=1 Tax=uncultured Brachyspira sp. TaxID=221953 RepID=UPI002610DF4F|nr:VWA domain-containing protein [uncultured Brachyspira sp.]